MKSNLIPPKASRIAHQHVLHNDVRSDPYYWLRDRDNPDVTAYLEAENEYAKAVLAHTKPLQEQLIKEMYSRIVKEDTSAPVRYGPYEYYTRTCQHDDYPEHWRRHVDNHDITELVVDENDLASGCKYFHLGEYLPSPDHNWVGYATDTSGREIYTIEVKHIADRRVLPTKLTNCSGNFVWSQDSRYIFYTTLNEAHRPYRLYRHRLTDDSANDVLIYEESDEAFYMEIGKSDSKKFIQVTLASEITSEVWLLEADGNDINPKRIFERKNDVLYQVQDHENDLYVLTNLDAVNFRLMKTTVANPDISDWQTVIAHCEDATLTALRIFTDFIAVGCRSDGLPKVRVLGHTDNCNYVVENPPEIQELRLSKQWEFDTSVCRVSGTALNMPYSVYDLNMTNGELSHIKTNPVGGQFDPQDYSTERHFATSSDGTQVPVYLVYHKNTDRTKPAPLLLYGYGAYGISQSLHFSSKRLSLLDRGIVVALTQIRGGSELGRKWYLDGKLKNKKNTFEDFNACADFLIENGVTSSDQLAIEGGSAGGLVVGNFINSSNHQCKAALAIVPFVDSLTTILDETLPLSIVERDEWGNPESLEIYRYMKSYAPYDNTRPGEYPALYVTAGFNDPRVGYWEPAKWVAKIRHCKTNDNIVALVTQMQAGHGGASGRKETIKTIAREFAFVIDNIC